MYYLANMLTLYSVVNSFRLLVLQNKRSSVWLLRLTSYFDIVVRNYIFTAVVTYTYGQGPPYISAPLMFLAKHDLKNISCQTGSKILKKIATSVDSRRLAHYMAGNEVFY